MRISYLPAKPSDACEREDVEDLCACAEPLPASEVEDNHRFQTTTRRPRSPLYREDQLGMKTYLSRVSALGHSGPIEPLTPNDGNSISKHEFGQTWYGVQHVAFGPQPNHKKRQDEKDFSKCSVMEKGKSGAICSATETTCSGAPRNLGMSRSRFM